LLWALNIPWRFKANARLDTFLPVPTSLTGQTLSHYQVLEKIGDGSRGVVYLARDLQLSRCVVLKILRTSVLTNAVSRSRFLREARTAASLAHPNIITIYDWGYDQGCDFMVMEHVPGMTLDRILSEGLLPLPTSLSYSRQISDALVHAHASRILHRDVKPSNILIADSGAVKLLDFSLAKSWRESAPTGFRTDDTQEGTILGTWGYMSPEQVQGKPADARSDIFSFGAVFLEMLAGRPAFKRQSFAETRRAILEENPLDPPPGVPPDILEIARRCLEKDPHNRFQAIGEISEALKSVEVGTPTVAEVMAPPKQGRMPPWRNRLWVTLAVLVFIFAALALIVRSPRAFQRLFAFVIFRADGPHHDSFQGTTTSFGRVLARSTSENSTRTRIHLSHFAGSMTSSPDDKQLFVASSDAQGSHILSVIDLQNNGVRQVPLPAHAASLAASRNGKLYLGSHIEGIMVYDFKQARLESGLIATHGPVWDIAVSPDGDRLFLAMSQSGVRRLSTRTGELKTITEAACPEKLALDPSGRRLYVSYQCAGPGGRAGHDSIEIFNAENEQRIGLFQGPPIVGGKPVVSPDGQLMILDGSDACSAPQYDHVGCSQVPSHIYYLFRPADRSVLRTFSFRVSNVDGAPQFLDNSRVIFLGTSFKLIGINTNALLEEWNLGSVSYPQAIYLSGKRRLYVGSPAAQDIMVLETEDPVCAPPEMGLVDLYSADGTLDDVANVTTLVANGHIEFVPGRVGQAFFFDGTGGYLLGPRTAHYGFGVGDSTLSLYFKLTVPSGEMTLLERMTADRTHGFELSTATDGRLLFTMTTTTGPSTLLSSRPLLGNHWYHAVITKTDHEIALYVDGRLDANRYLTADASIPSPSDDRARLHLGAFDDGQRPLRGWLDEVALYNRALTAEEVTEMYRRRESEACLALR
jgi:serine/threonine protein kinase